MAECQQCGRGWPGLTLLKRYTTLDAGMECPYCGTPQYLTRAYRRRSLFAVLVIPLLIFVPVFINLGIIVIILSAAAIISIILGIQLFTMELSSTPETRRDGA